MNILIVHILCLTVRKITQHIAQFVKLAECQLEQLFTEREKCFLITLEITAPLMLNVL